MNCDILIYYVTTTIPLIIMTMIFAMIIDVIIIVYIIKTTPDNIDINYHIAINHIDADMMIMIYLIITFLSVSPIPLIFITIIINCISF